MKPSISHATICLCMALILASLSISQAGIQEGADAVDPLGCTEPAITLEYPEWEKVAEIVRVWEQTHGSDSYTIGTTDTGYKLTLFLAPQGWLDEEDCHPFSGFNGPLRSCASCADNLSSCMNCANARTWHAMSTGGGRSLADHELCLTKYGLR